MARGRQLPNIVERGFRGRIGEPKPRVDLSGLRTPGGRYREQIPNRPYRDPLLHADLAYPRSPAPYRDDPHYRVLDREPYSWPIRYEPEESEWDYDAPPPRAFLNGPHPARDLEPRERPLTYEESVRRLTLLQELMRERTAGQVVYGQRGEMPGPLEPWPDVLDVADEPTLAEAAPVDTAVSLGDGEAHAAGVDAIPMMSAEVECGGLDQIVLDQEPAVSSAGPDAWAMMDHSTDDLSRAEQAFDQQLEDIVGNFHRQERAFAEPDWGPTSVLPEPEGLAPPEPPDPLLQPPAPPGLGVFRF